MLLLVLGVCALGVLVAVSSWRSEDGGEGERPRAGEPTAGSDRLRGPDVPPEGALPGRLWVVVPAGNSDAGDCQLRAIDLGAVELEPPGVLEHCTLVDVSRDGRYAVAGDDDLQLALIDLRERPERRLDLEPSFRETSPRTTRVAALDPAGRRVAWCAADNETAVVSLDGGERERFVGCDPRFGPDGALFTRTLPPLADEVRRDGRAILAGREFRQGLELETDGAASLLAYDVGASGRVATKVRRVFGLPQPTVQLWSGGSLEGSHRVSGLAPSLQSSGVELSPDETRVAFGWRGLLAGVLDFGFERTSRTLEHGAYAFSPDGRWLAIGEGRRIAIYARGSDAPTYVMPVATLMLAWSE